MDLSYLDLFIPLVAGLLPLVCLLILEYSRLNLLVLLSPASIYTIFYLLIFFRYNLFLASGYQLEFSTITNESIELSSFLIAASSIPYVLGYVFGLRIQKSIYLARLQKSANLQRSDILPILLVLNDLFLVLSAVAILIIGLHSGIFTDDLGINRKNYLNIIQGNGWIGTLFSLAPVVVICRFSVAGKVRFKNVWGILVAFSAIALLSANLLVSNRSSLSIAMLALVIYFLLRHSQRRTGIVSFVFGLLLLVATVFLATLLGIVRSGNDNLAFGFAHPLSYLFYVLVFLTATIDMGEGLATVLSQKTQLYPFLSLQDIFYTYLPRALFPEKPLVYGSRMIESIYYGRTDNELQLSTFPLGLFAEGFVNLGFLGTFLFVFIVSMATSFLFMGTLSYLAPCHSHKSWAGYVCAFLYFACCSNGLGYMRGFGSFFATILFLGFMMFLAYIVVVAISQYANPRL